MSDAPFNLSWPPRRVVVVLCGGVAIIKALEVIRRLRDEGVAVTPIMTASAQRFVSPLLVQALADASVERELFDAASEQRMGHIRLTRDAAAILVMPTTADMMARLAQGRADDLATAAILAAQCPVVLAPAMNPAMWSAPPTRRNVTTLQQDGRIIIPPARGMMACGEEGEGRFPEAQEVIEELRAALTPKVLRGRKVVVTAGPTREWLDPVRFISNPSSGAMGVAVAQAARAAGAHVVLIHGPLTVALPAGIETVAVESARDMAVAVEGQAPDSDIGIFVAAVSDFRVADPKGAKMARSDHPEVLALVENPDILAMAGKKNWFKLRIGFAAQTEDVAEKATEKCRRKQAHLVAGNQVGAGLGFGVGANRLEVVDREGTVSAWGPEDKRGLAERLIALAAQRLERIEEAGA